MNYTEPTRSSSISVACLKENKRTVDPSAEWCCKARAFTINKIILQHSHSHTLLTDSRTSCIICETHTQFTQVNKLYECVLIHTYHFIIFLRWSWITLDLSGSPTASSPTPTSTPSCRPPQTPKVDVNLTGDIISGAPADEILFIQLKTMFLIHNTDGIKVNMCK